MQILINEKAVEFPATLTDITLGQRIDFHNEYGYDLEEELTSVLQQEDGIDKDIALQMYHDNVAACFVAFFSGCTVEAVKEFVRADVVLALYHSVYGNLIEEENSMELESEYDWNGEQWSVQSPVLSQHHPMTFGELIDAKQIMKDLAEDKGSKWDLLLRIACIFLRKPGENYNNTYLTPDGERWKLMETLPMNIAIGMGFFLTSSIDLFKNTLAFSTVDGAGAEEVLRSISIAGDGSTSSKLSRKQKYSTSRIVDSILSTVQDKRKRSTS